MNCVRERGVDTSEVVTHVSRALGVTLQQSLELVGKEGTVRGLAQRTRADVLKVKDLGPKTAERLDSIFHLCRLYAREQLPERAPLRSPRDVVAVMEPVLKDLTVEELHVLCLDASHRMTHDVTITRGLLNSSLIHPREVFRQAIAHSAGAIIIVHNHPSGDPTPSAEDRAVTEQLVCAGRLLDIPVHDHVIIGAGRYTSFAETGLL